MISQALRPGFFTSLLWLVAISLAMLAPDSSRAGIALGPKISEDPAEAEQRRITQFYEAQKSNQEKLKAGKSRYDQKLESRAKLLAAMSAEVAARQQTITLPPPTVIYAQNPEPRRWGGTVVGLVVIALAFLGFRYYLSRLDSKKPIARKV